MHYPLVLIIAFFFATRSLTLGIESSGRSESRPMISAEKECELLTIMTFCLLGLLVSLSLMIRFPDLGAVIAEYNKF